MELDRNLEYLINELKKNKIFEKINLIVTSDHGMEKVNGKENAIFLDKHVNTSYFDAFGSSVVYDLFLKNSKHIKWSIFSVETFFKFNLFIYINITA